MTPSNKDTIYIDIDEEITGIIDKVRGSSGKIVALVLPKRASAFQSIVNMKLLKRSADNAKKHLVLVTSESSLMPLAGAVGLHVAKTPQSKPEIPAAPLADDGSEEMIDEDSPAAFSAAAAANKPVGELASQASKPGDDMETLELDEDDEAALAAGAPLLPVAGAIAGTKKPKKNSKLAVPNFERFRLLLALGIVGIILLITGLVFALSVLPKAQIAIKTNASTVNVGLDLVLDTAAKEVDTESGTIPAKLVSQQKTSTQQAPATGQRNNGERAKGEVRISNCSDEDELTIPAGTGVSSNGLTFITQNTVTFELSGKTSRGCVSRDGVTAQTVSVTAQAGGAKYNLPAATNFTVASVQGVEAASTEEFTGGTDVIVKVVTQADIDAAKQKISAAEGSIKQDLRKLLQGDNLTAITSTYAAAQPKLTNSAEAGSVADNVTVTSTTNYSMFGIKQDDLEKVVKADIDRQIDTKKQDILNNGIDEATYRVANRTETVAEVDFETVATAGPDLKIDDLKKQVAGKKPGDIKQMLQNVPGVTDVQVVLSPFWVNSVPKKTEKITITIADPAPAAVRDSEER